MEKNITPKSGSDILLAEDNPFVLKSMRMMLEKDTHRVTTAEDGEAALELFSKLKFDLVITDFDMPKMDGLRLAVAIRRLVPDQRILLITAKPDEVGAPQGLFDAILVKPFLPQSLREAIAKLMG